MARAHALRYEHLLGVRVRFYTPETLIPHALTSHRRLGLLASRGLESLFLRGKPVPNSLYELIGGAQGLEQLVKAYIDVLRTRPEAQHLRSLYPDNLDHYELRMIEFLSGWLGGPALYLERHGMPMLREKHRGMPIDAQVRDEWMFCMRLALEKTIQDNDLRVTLEGAFWRMADSLKH